MNNSDMPAMPLATAHLEVNGDTVTMGGCCGLTKREHFAAMAMQGFIREYGSQGEAACAMNAVDYADALLKELEK